ncbi:MAG: alanine--tRNA ligase [Saprospiraceae bacterium]|nr:alanine--tRNA ligase [Saprospiraceae bacterium]
MALFNQIKDMTSSEIRRHFLEFFKSKLHYIERAAPIVLKNDPTLLFTNAGMNQFKDLFLGNKPIIHPRIADTQKCLRVSGKHNDLEEVGLDSYHHTMFEMLGNWSFGDYFKQEAIDWAWELLTGVYQIDPERLYASVFTGDVNENLARDDEAAGFWKKYLPEERIILGSKRDNFWEMGDTGPCGPCSEIHVDIRSEDERKKIPGKDLVNNGHPQVIEIWNLVFIQFNRKADGKLEELPSKHVDTGMGFERLCMVLQGKSSSYDTDVFSGMIAFIEKNCGITYNSSYEHAAKSDIAMRVLADHIRAVAFTIADGELPSNTGAGYVIRRILRRAVRYYYSFLHIRQPFFYTLIPKLAKYFEDVFPELIKQQDFISKVIEEEEKAFLRTLEGGLKRLDALTAEKGELRGRDAFELYDTFGFPIDLTRLICAERDMKVDDTGFQLALDQQRARSRAASVTETGDWIMQSAQQETLFVGYEHAETEAVRIIKYRTVKSKDKLEYQLVLDKTPFYAEGGGQLGDTGILQTVHETIRVLNTKKENDLPLHFVDRLPADPMAVFHASIDLPRRKSIENNHSATHLLHAALRKVLGGHVHQKGSLVTDQYLRFDFSHFQKLNENELIDIEHLVNQKIRENIHLDEARNISIRDAQASGAMMLFGEKYGDQVRMITFDPAYSRELCGGCHVLATGKIGFFKIISESAVAAGVRRIEAITADSVERYFKDQESMLHQIKETLKNPKDLIVSLNALVEENKTLKHQLTGFQEKELSLLKQKLKQEVKSKDGVQFIISHLNNLEEKEAKNLSFQLEKELSPAYILFGFIANGKPMLMLQLSNELVQSKSMNAVQLIKGMATHIQGGGGGQPFYATAGGKNPSGLKAALDEALKSNALN